MTELNRTTETQTGAAADAVTASLLHEAGAWAKAQGALLSGVEAIWADWIERRREAIDATARSLQEMCACRSVADLARIQQQWLAGAVHRAACDAAALASGAVVMTRLAAEGATSEAARGRVSPVRAGRPAPSREREGAEPQRQAAE
jgi:Phasin protein